MPVSPALDDRLRAQWQGAPNWYGSGLVAAPGTGAVLADTGPLAAGSYLFHVIASGDTSFNYTVQLRNAGNSATVADPNGNPQQQTSGVAAPAVSIWGQDQIVFGNKVILAAANQRLRVILATTATAGGNSPQPANCMVSILVQEVVSSDT